MTPTPEREQWLIQHAATFGAHTWPEGSLLAITSKAAGFSATYVPITDAEAAWAASARWGHVDTYVGMGVMRPEAAMKRGRGTKGDVLALGHLWLDVDTAEGEHAETKLPNPTYAAAGRLCRGLIGHTLAIASGGGMHCYYTLAEPVRITSRPGVQTETGRDFLARWADRWSTRFNADGYNVDSKVSRTPTSVLRMAGTLNAKKATPTLVRIVEVTERRFEHADITALCPEQPKIRVITGSGRTIERSLDPHRAVRAVGGTVARRLNHALSVITLIEGVWGCQPAEADRWLYPNPDGTLGGIGSTSSAQVYPLETGGIDAVTAFSARLQTDWNVPDENHSLRPFDLVTIALNGNPLLARTLASHHLDADDLDGLIDVLHAAVQRQRSEGQAAAAAG